MSENRTWKGRIALITGASSGIGSGVALALAEMGMKLAISARRVHRLEELAPQLKAAGAEDVLILPMDMRQEQDIIDGFARIESHWGSGVHVLINNAGLGAAEPLMSGDTDAWRNMLEVNVLAVAVATREAIGQMQAHGGPGHVIHISSMSGYRVTQGSGMYSASKHAVRAMTEGLRGELRAAKSTIRVSAVSPGFVETEFAQKYHGNEEAAESTYGNYPVLQIDDLGRTVRFLLESPAHMEVHDILLRPRDQVT